MKQGNSRRSFMKTCLGGGALLGLAAATPAVLALLPGPARAGETGKLTEHTQSRLLMGTVVSITVSHRDSSFAHAAIEKAFAEIRGQASIFNRHDPDSPLSQLNRRGNLAGAPRELCGLVKEALQLGQRLPSFDLTVAPLVDLLRSKANPGGELRLDRSELAAARALVDRQAVFVGGDSLSFGKSGMAITLDGIAKGAITDRASAVLYRLGAKDHLINSGGDIYASGSKLGGRPWRVGISHPSIAKALSLAEAELPVSLLCNRGMATSGTYEAFYDEKRSFHHLIDPAQGGSQQYSCSVTVTAPSAKLADALATALSAMPLERALETVDELPGCAAFFITAAGRPAKSSNWT